MESLTINPKSQSIVIAPGKIYSRLLRLENQGDTVIENIEVIQSRNFDWATFSVQIERTTIGYVLFNDLFQEKLTL